MTLEPVLTKPAFRRQPGLTHCAEFNRARLPFATEKTPSKVHNGTKNSTESHPCGGAAARRHQARLPSDSRTESGSSFISTHQTWVQ